MPPRMRAAAKRCAKAASTAVFDTVELLENILLNLPVKNLLLDARVCRKWKEVINGLISLQRALFMTPEPVECMFRLRRPGQVNKIPEDDATREFTGNKGGSDFIAARINPLIGSQTEPDEDIFERARVGASETVRTWQLLDDTKFTSSWRRMFLTQPPETKICFGVDYNKAHRNGQKVQARQRQRGTPLDCVSSSEGVRVGKLKDTMLERSAVLVDPERLLLFHTRAVADAEEMKVLHEMADNNPNRPWTDEDRHSEEDPKKI